MGVDWLTCNVCGENFPNCGSFVCCECGMTWCSDECANENGWREDADGDASCNFCRGEDYEDYKLLERSLELLNLSREELIKKMKTN